MMNFVTKFLLVTALASLVACQTAEKTSKDDTTDRAANQTISQPPAVAPLYENLSPKIDMADAKNMVRYLASADLKGRMTGSPEEKEYHRTLIRMSKKMGLRPIDSTGAWTHDFEFTQSVVAPEAKNSLALGGKALKLGDDWTPVSSSQSDSFKGEDMVFVGYGLEAPSSTTVEAYSSFKGREVLAGQWLVMLRDIPSEVDEEKRAHYFAYSRRDHKVLMAKERKAAGVIFITGPKTNLPSELISLTYDAASGTHDIPVISMTREAFLGALEKRESFDLVALQKKLDRGEQLEMQRIQTKPLQLTIGLEQKRRKGASFLALLEVPGAAKTVVVGGHGDHLGDKPHRGSLKSAEMKDTIHYGADDNASGVAAVMEIAHYLSDRVKNKKTKLRQNVLFAVWSGEELGTLGSIAWLKSSQAKRLNITSYLNMDMIGRMKDVVSLQGTGSSEDWQELIEKMSMKKTLPIVVSKDPYLPTDAMPFYLEGIPVLGFFTGAHADYHKPTDTADKILYGGLVEIADYVAGMTELLASRDTGPRYNKVERKGSGTKGRGFRIFLGTIPDYSQEGVKGVRLQGVVKGGPAEKAGLKGGDVIVKFSTHDVKSLYDYVYTLQVVKPGEKTMITVLREGKSVDLPITPSMKK